MNAAACLTWIKRGAAKSKPDRLRLSDKQLSKLVRAGGSNEEEEEDDEEEEEGGEAGTSAGNDTAVVPSTGSNGERGVEVSEGGEGEKTGRVTGRVTGDHVVDTYGLDDYDDDDDEDVASRAISMAGLSYYGKNADDPYLKESEDSDDNSDDELLIGPEDNLVVVGKASGDEYNLEVWVYDEAAGNLYCHHDYILSNFPIAVEWIGMDPGDGSDGNLVAVGYTSPVIELWDIDVVNTLDPAFSIGSVPDKKKKKLKTGASADAKKKGHTDAVLALSWNRLNRSCLASASADWTTGIWDLTEGTAVTMLQQHTDKVQCLQWHPCEQRILLTGSFDRSVKMCDVGAPTSEGQSWHLSGEVEKVTWNVHDPNQFLASTDGGKVYCFDVRGRVPLYSFTAHTGAVTGLALSCTVPGCLVTTSDDHSVRVWDVRGVGAQTMVVERKCKIGSIFCAAASPDSAMLFAIGGENEMKVLNLKSDAAVSACFLDAPKTEDNTVTNAELATGGTGTPVTPSSRDSDEELENDVTTSSSDEHATEEKSTMQKAASEKLKKKSSRVRDPQNRLKKHKKK